MTREEAIKIMEQRECCRECVVSRDYTCKECETAFEVAIKALEQQTCEDAVSRQAVLKIQAKYAEHMGATKFWQMRDDVKALPPVNPVEKQEPCEDAVSREAVLGLFAQNADAVRPYSKTWEEVKALPSVNPQPKTKTGHWIDCGSYYRCSECDNWVDEVDGMPKFCDECGAKMVEPQESEGDI